MSRKRKSSHRLSPRTAAPDVRASLARALVSAQPHSRRALWEFVRATYGLAVPRRRVCPGHAAPMDYLAQAILEPGRDLVVWASRGGAKTELGSVAAHLDSILRPGCQTRILGGSLDQSEKMYEYLTRKWDGPFAALLAREPTARRTELANGSAIEVLTQSPRSVRGHRVHRLKCDEVDEFSPEVWQAAQFITQSSPGTDGRWIAAQMDVFSTMHRPFGPMAELVDRVLQRGTPATAGKLRAECGVNGDGENRGGPFSTPHSELRTPNSALRTPHSLSPLLLKWCLWEVIEPCPAERSCSRCPLAGDCEGRARGADGYFPIDDAIAQKARASRQAWEAEMLCLRPRAEGLVFPDFSPAHHVAPVRYDPGLPLYRAIDFGYANPFVCLWVQVRGQCGVWNAAGGMKDLRSPLTPHSELGTPHFPGPDLSGVQLRVVAEYVERERPVSQHAREMAARDPGPVLATYADPAGWQRSDITGTGPCQELARLGLRVRTPRAGILEGVEMLRRLLKERPAAAGPGLVVDPSCRWLARAFQEYHWQDGPEGRREVPAKDGADHPIDALRYLVTGLFLRRGGLRERRW
jgi:hypothetical protein